MLGSLIWWKCRGQKQICFFFRLLKSLRFIKGYITFCSISNDRWKLSFLRFLANIVKLHRGMWHMCEGSIFKEKKRRELSHSFAVVKLTFHFLYSNRLEGSKIQAGRRPTFTTIESQIWYSSRDRNREANEL